jgi:hypothetical protein
MLNHVEYLNYVVMRRPFQHVPQGEWFCPDCRPKDVKRSPRKGRRRTFSEREEVSSGEEEESEAEIERLKYNYLLKYYIYTVTLYYRRNSITDILSVFCHVRSCIC